MILKELLLRFVLAGLAVFCLLPTIGLFAQAKPMIEESPSPSETNNNLGPVGIVPKVRGFNATLISSSQHDSSTGWSNLLTPAVAYRLNAYLSADASAPVFTYLNSAAITTSRNGTSATALQTVHGVAGDTAVAVHLDLPLFRSLSYTFTPTLSLPTGNKARGIGAGKVTYDFNNHFEVDLPLSPYVELGFGDTNNLVNRRVRRNQTSVGKLAHFEFGGSLDLPRHLTFDLSAFEILPVGDQNIYATRTVRKRTTTVVTGTTGLAEDNGLNASLDIPLQRHMTLSGFYYRSIRQHNDTGGFSLTFFARPRPEF